MKKCVLSALALGILLFCATAAAEPSPTPSYSAKPTVSPAASGSSELIVYRNTGETVLRIQLRLRELGYFNFKPTGNFQSMSVEATKKFQQRQLDANGQPIMSDGTVGAQSMSILFSQNAVRAEIVAGIPVGPLLSGSPKVTGELVDWNEVKPLLKTGQVYTVTDFNTGMEFNITFTGGENHAEVECTSATDVIELKSVFGGDFSFFKRPAVINIDGRNIAAALQGFPHGGDTISGNDMDGHLCLYFSGSRSHVCNLPDAEITGQIYKAAGRG